MRTDPRTSASFPFPPRDVPLKNMMGRAPLLLLFDDEAEVFDDDDSTEEVGDGGGDAEEVELGGDCEPLESEALGEGEAGEFRELRCRD